MSIDFVRAVPNSSYGQDDNLTRALVQFRVLRLRIHELGKAISDTRAVEGRVEWADEPPVPGLDYEAGLVRPGGQRILHDFVELCLVRRQLFRVQEWQTATQIFILIRHYDAPFKIKAWGIRSYLHSSHLAKARSKLSHKQLGLFERGEMAAAIQPVPINQIRIALLGPAARRAEKLFREHAAAHRNSNLFNVAFVEAFPI